MLNAEVRKLSVSSELFNAEVRKSFCSDDLSVSARSFMRWFERKGEGFARGRDKRR